MTHLEFNYGSKWDYLDLDQEEKFKCSLWPSLLIRYYWEFPEARFIVELEFAGFYITLELVEHFK